MRTLDDHLFGPGPKRILSLDGGGVRGLITLGILQQVEHILEERSPDREAFRLADYFDLIGGTSTGGIIATLLALRYRVHEIRDIYRRFCPSVFHRTRTRTVMSFAGLRQSKFDVAAFERNIDAVLADYMRNKGLAGEVADLKLDTAELSTGLGIVMKRIDTGSVWALTNNPRMKYWDPNSPLWADEEDKDFFPNREYALKDLARATASAPFYLDAIDLRISPKERGLFLDGGASPFNNPALELFMMTTLKQYDDEGRLDAKRPFSPFGFDWETGEDKLLLYSVGTGSFRSTHDCDEFKRSLNMTKARHALCGMIDDSMKSSLIWCQALSEPASPFKVDGNLKQMRGLRVTPHKFMTFKRVDPFLDRIWSERELDISLLGGRLHRARSLDNSTSRNLDLLQQIGKAAADKLVSADDFPADFEPVYKA